MKKKLNIKSFYILFILFFCCEDSGVEPVDDCHGALGDYHCGACYADSDPCSYNNILEIFKNNCMSCHISNNDGGLNLSSCVSLLEGGTSGSVIVTGDINNSLLYTKVLDGSMPPDPNISLGSEEIDDISNWINNCAP